MLIQKKVLQNILETFDHATVESGGIIGRCGQIIIAFEFDGGCHSSMYRPNRRRLNKIIEEWSKRGILFAGIVHSHPNYVNILSEQDKAFAESIFHSAPFIEKIYFPLIVYRNGHAEMYSYRYAGIWEKDEIMVVDG